MFICHCLILNWSPPKHLSLRWGVLKVGALWNHVAQHTMHYRRLLSYRRSDVFLPREPLVDPGNQPESEKQGLELPLLSILVIIHLAQASTQLPTQSNHNAICNICKKKAESIFGQLNSLSRGRSGVRWQKSVPEDKCLGLLPIERGLNICLQRWSLYNLR